MMRLRKDGQPDRRAGRSCPRGQSCPAYKHGYRNSPEYHTWRAMKARCLNSNDPAYPRYGARGITVDPRWAESFEAFLADMGQRSEGTSLDRIDNNDGYHKQNCRWATRSEQGANMRINHLITITGVTKPLAAWAREYKIVPKTIVYRVQSLGWSYEQAVTTPKLRKRSNCYAVQ